MEKYFKEQHTEERALFSSRDSLIEECEFSEGESPLKESRNIEVSKCVFQWKYPLWYCKNVKVKETTFEESARSGIWYTENIVLECCKILAPKTFRNAKQVRLISSTMPNAKETFWGCEDIKIFSVTAEGDYFGAHCQNVEVDNLNIKGNYVFDSSKDVVVRNSYLESKDAFWNCENVTLINCTIIGEYLGWNTKNLTLINCKIESHQGLCYVDGLKMYHCEVKNSDLILEYCHNIDAEIVTEVDSIKNPYDGKIVVKDVKELILDRRFVDPAKIKIYRSRR